jgi:hypothetical protein
LDRRRFFKYAGAGALGALAAGAAGYYAHDQLDMLRGRTIATATASGTLTLDMTPPVIQDLKWKPTRVVNDKVYDAKISFIAWDMDSHVESITVDFVPVEYSHLPKEAFPKEDARRFASQPGSMVAGFEQEVRDLKGGREYEIRVTAKDASGNAANSSLTTPYVREFENIAPLDDVTVIADYYTWYSLNGWKDEKGRPMHVYTPLLGEYNSADPIVVSKHIDWATGHGVDAFAISWWGEDPDMRLAKFENTFLKHSMLGQIKFCIIYENNGRLKIQNPNDSSEKWIEDLDDPFNKERLISDFVNLTKYFSHPQYLKIDGKPYVGFDYTLPFRGDVTGVFTELRNKLKERGWELYLVNDLCGRTFYPEDLISKRPHLPSEYTPYLSPEHALQVIESFDAIEGGPPLIPPSMDFADAYKMWHHFATNYQKDFVPSSWSGLEIHPLVLPNSQPIKLSSDLFRNLLNPSIKYNTKKVIEIHTFNEWFFGNQIEPADEYGFDYLNTLKESLVTNHR